MPRTDRGFTLVELLIVIAIIGLLFAMFVQTLAGIDFLKKNTGCQKNLKDIHFALQAYTGASDGRYPYPIDTWAGDDFSGPYVTKDRWAGLPQLRLLMQFGAEKEMFFCPFDPKYGDWGAWPASTWEEPYFANWNNTVFVSIGYTSFLYRNYPYGTGRFSDMKDPIIDINGLDDTPIMADILRMSGSSASGWYHGGSVPDGAYNSDCNTLFKNGAVVHTDKDEFDWGSPSFMINNDLNGERWWCALKP